MNATAFLDPLMETTKLAPAVSVVNCAYSVAAVAESVFAQAFQDFKIIAVPTSRAAGLKHLAKKSA